MVERVYLTFKKHIKVELLLSILFLLTPFILPLTSGELLPSISAYAYATNSKVFELSLIFIAHLISIDGVLDRERRYNIILGLLMLFVVVFPMDEFRMIHDLVAILFFIGNAYIVTYHTQLIPKWLKISASILIFATIFLFMVGAISLFMAESVGFILMSAFMYIRYLSHN